MCLLSYKPKPKLYNNSGFHFLIIFLTTLHVVMFSFAYIPEALFKSTKVNLVNASKFIQATKQFICQFYEVKLLIQDRASHGLTVCSELFFLQHKCD